MSNVLGPMIEDSLPPSISPLVNIPVEIGNWLEGKIDMPPEQVQGVLQDINDKLTWAQAYIQISQLVRLAPMFNSLKIVQESLFKPTAIRALTTKELIALHKRLSKDIDSVLTNVRKFTGQNEERLARLGKSKGDFLDMLRSIDPTILEKVMAGLRGM